MEFKNTIFGLLLAGTLCVGLAACGGEETDESGPGGSGDSGDNPAVVGPSNTLSQEEQKAKLDQVGREFITHVQKSEVQNVIDVMRHLNNISKDDENNSEVTDWVDNILDNIDHIYIGDSEKKEEDYWGNIDIISYKNYKSVYYASQFKGNFTYDAKNEKWVYSKSNGLTFNFQDASGRNCELALITSGSEKVVFVGEEESYFDSNFDSNTIVSRNSYYSAELDKYYIAIPQNVQLVLTQAGTVISKVTVKADLSSINSENFDFSKDKFNVSATLTLQNLSVEVNNLVYQPNGASGVDIYLKHNGTTIYSATASVNSSVTGVYDQMEIEPEVNSLKAVNVSVDVLGKVQVKGTISDFMKMADYLNIANDEYYMNESNFKSYVNQANGLMNLSLYYDKTPTIQAQLKLECFKCDGWYSSYWEYEPVLLFKDGTTYSTFETFFNETDFKQLIKAAENLFDSYDNEISKL